MPLLASLLVMLFCDMTNEELLNEYEFTIAFYITASNSKDKEVIEKYESYLCELRAEILKRME